MAEKVFISYDYDNDRHYKNLLLAWDANKEFDFNFNDQSVDVSVDSVEAAAIQRVISARLNNSTCFLCIIGKQTNKSDWVDWEIKKAYELSKKIIAVKVDSDYTSPDAILGIGAKLAMSFTFDAIKKAIEEA